MKTIHLILNAHIDPIWLWPWEAGLDAVLATCRSACDRLDAHPDIIFTRGEAWVYQQVERTDPALFARIRAHVAAGRWEIVGGWWIQPDCNQPSGWGMVKQIKLGKQYFEAKFKQFPRIGYNVDTFGHAATLPGLMRQAGQDRYIMMRPGPHEMTLPACLFRWRGFEDGPEVVTFRIQSGYTTHVMNLGHFEAAVAAVPEGVEHTMAFVGVGDHGGGPTEQQIAWCRQHARAIDGWELVFSSPSRFFDAVADQTQHLPLVTGELQQHAIGCYSVTRQVKTHLRRAEHLLAQADVAALDLAALPGTSARLRKAWEDVCFHQFHDTLGGTCLPSAYVTVSDQLGRACAAANETIACTLRRKMVSLPDHPQQRMVFWNPSDASFSGYVEFEPWLEWNVLGQGVGLTDSEGHHVPHQFLAPEAAMHGLQRLLFPLDLAPDAQQVITIVREGAAAVQATVQATPERLSNDVGVRITPEVLAFPGDLVLPRPTLEVIEDPTDTWSHGIDRYPSTAIACAQWHRRTAVDTGPLMASWIEEGTLGERSLVSAEWRVYSGEAFVSLNLTIDFQETHRLVKLTLPLPDAPASRTDGILGGALVRPNDGRELPLRDWTLLGPVGIVCPDVYALDATSERVRLTLLRSPLMAHHDPHPGASLAPRPVYADQGVHRFRFRFYAGPTVSPDILDAAALSLQRSPSGADLTRGMLPAAAGHTEVQLQ